MVLTGAAVFTDAVRAQAFRDGVEKARADTLGSFTSRFLLRQLRLEGAASRLATRVDGRYVTFSTSLSYEEALALLERAAAFSREFFLGRREP